jgi:hypothetical protein
MITSFIISGVIVVQFLFLSLISKQNKEILSLKKRDGELSLDILKWSDLSIDMNEDCIMNERCIETLANKQKNFEKTLSKHGEKLNKLDPK